MFPNVNNVFYSISYFPTQYIFPFLCQCCIIKTVFNFMPQREFAIDRDF